MSSKHREALGQIHELLSIGGKPDTAMCIRYEAANQIAKAALAEPVLNCEVGTPEEQVKRHDEFCEAYTTKCGNDVNTYDCILCFARWSQMPYESEVK